MVPVRAREWWFSSLGEIALNSWDIPKRERNFGDGKGKMLSQEGHLQYRAVPFDALGIQQGGLNQTSCKLPLGDSDLKEVLDQGAWHLQGTTTAPGLSMRRVGMKRRNWSVLALKGAKEGYGPPDSPDIVLIYPAFHKHSSQDDRNDPHWRSEDSHHAGTALLPSNVA